MKTTQEFSKRLKDEGVYVKSIVFPTVPRGTGRVRNMPTAAHTKTCWMKQLRLMKSRKRNEVDLIFIYSANIVVGFLKCLVLPKIQV